jgi:murein L,D-transpeptidase YafK
MSLSQSKKDKQMERDSQLLVKLQKEKSDTELLTASLRADVANTYSQLEEQIKANHRLVMQLEKERIRASGLEN